MIKPTGLLAACGVLAVLGGTVLWFQKHPTKTDSALPVSPKILALGEDQIEGIRIVRVGAEAIVLKKTGGKWVMSEPKPLDADADVIRSMVSSLAALNGDRLIDESPASLVPYSLATPPLEVDVTVKGGAVNKLLFGADTPAGNDVYAKLEASPKVYTVSTSTKSNFEKSVKDLRDKRLLTFNSDKITAISVTSKGPAFEFAKNGGAEWQITKPKPYRADANQVDDLVRKLKDAKMDLAAAPGAGSGEDDQKKSAADFASAAKVATVTVTDNTGPQTLEVRQGKGKDEKEKIFYAKSTAVEGVYKLTGDLADGLKDKDVDSFRNKKLYDFGFNDPTKVEINGAAYQKTGADTGAKWTGPAGQVDPGSIQTVIDKLRDLSASKFTEKMAGTQTLEIAVTSGANKIEKLTMNKNGEEIDAQRGGEPSIYVVDSGLFSDLQKAVSGIKPYQAPKLDKKSPVTKKK